MPLRLPDPGSFEDLLRPARIDVASLVRLSRYPATEPYWSAGVHRFDDPEPGRASAFGTCYTAAVSKWPSLKVSSMSPGDSQGAPTSHSAP